MIRRTWLTLLYLLPFFLRESCQLPPGHPLASAVEIVNESGPFIGVVMAYDDEANALLSSGEFFPNSDLPSVDLYGRKFHVGRIRDVDVIYVMSGQRRLNAGVTVQILLDNFKIWGIVHYGTAGSSNDSLSFGDVSVPRFVSFTGSWTWTKFQSEDEKKQPELTFGTYNLPKKGENLMSRVEFKPEEFFSVDEPMKEVFWFEIDCSWLQVAQQLQDLRLKRCVNETYCLPETPKVVFGLKVSTADVFVDNAAYRKYLFRRFEVSTVDEESAAVVMTAMSTDTPVIVIRGVSDLAGGESGWSSTSLSSLASTNALEVAINFIEMIKRRNLIA